MKTTLIILIFFGLGYWLGSPKIDYEEAILLSYEIGKQDQKKETTPIVNLETGEPFEILPMDPETIEIALAPPQKER
jgi:hypothetical protein